MFLFLTTYVHRYFIRIVLKFNSLINQWLLESGHRQSATTIFQMTEWLLTRHYIDAHSALKIAIIKACEQINGHGLRLLRYANADHFKIHIKADNEFQKYDLVSLSAAHRTNCMFHQNMMRQIFFLSKLHSNLQGYLTAFNLSLDDLAISNHPIMQEHLYSWKIITLLATRPVAILNSSLELPAPVSVLVRFNARMEGAARVKSLTDSIYEYDKKTRALELGALLRTALTRMSHIYGFNNISRHPTDVVTAFFAQSTKHTQVGFLMAFYGWVLTELINLHEDTVKSAKTFASIALVLADYHTNKLQHISTLPFLQNVRANRATNVNSNSKLNVQIHIAHQLYALKLAALLNTAKSTELLLSEWKFLTLSETLHTAKNQVYEFHRKFYCNMLNPRSLQFLAAMRQTCAKLHATQCRQLIEFNLTEGLLLAHIYSTSAFAQNKGQTRVHLLSGCILSLRKLTRDLTRDLNDRMRAFMNMRDTVDFYSESLQRLGAKTRKISLNAVSYSFTKKSQIPRRAKWKSVLHACSKQVNKWFTPTAFSAFKHNIGIAGFSIIFGALLFDQIPGIEGFTQICCDMTDSLSQNVCHNLTDFHNRFVQPNNVLNVKAQETTESFARSIQELQNFLNVCSRQVISYRSLLEMPHLSSQLTLDTRFSNNLQQQLFLLLENCKYYLESQDLLSFNWHNAGLNTTPTASECAQILFHHVALGVDEFVNTKMVNSNEINLLAYHVQIGARDFLDSINVSAAQLAHISATPTNAIVFDANTPHALSSLKLWVQAISERIAVEIIIDKPIALYCQILHDFEQFNLHYPIDQLFNQLINWDFSRPCTALNGTLVHVDFINVGNEDIQTIFNNIIKSPCNHNNDNTALTQEQRLAWDAVWALCLNRVEAAVLQLTTHERQNKYNTQLRRILTLNEQKSLFTWLQNVRASLLRASAYESTAYENKIESLKLQTWSKFKTYIIETNNLKSSNFEEKADKTSSAKNLLFPTLRQIFDASCKQEENLSLDDINIRENRNVVNKTLRINVFHKSNSSSSISSKKYFETSSDDSIPDEGFDKSHLIKTAIKQALTKNRKHADSQN